MESLSPGIEDSPWQGSIMDYFMDLFERGYGALLGDDRMEGSLMEGIPIDL
jgi:hypothetical protein